MQRFFKNEEIIMPESYIQIEDLKKKLIDINNYVYISYDMKSYLKILKFQMLILKKL